MRSFIALVAGILTASTMQPAFAAGAPAAPASRSVYVAGRQVRFEHLSIAYGDPVAPAGDAGLREMLSLVDAQITWQPGTRFAAITRADGKIITFTAGSNAVSIDGSPVQLPFAPFYEGADFELPLIPVARALNLGVRGFRGGYVFVPQILAVRGHAESRRAIVEMTASAPVEYRTSFDARAGTLAVAFPGFGTDIKGNVGLSTKAAPRANVSMSGPPGYPTTTVVVAVTRGERFASHHMAGNTGVELVIAKSEAALRVDDTMASAGTVTRSTPSPTPRPATPSPTPRPVAQPTRTPASSPTPTPAATAPASAVPTAQPVPATSPSPGAAPEPTDNGAPSPAPSATFAQQKITSITAADIETGTRLTLTLTGGPVTFEWHRLGDPDNRYWLDIKGVTLVGPSQAFTSVLPFVKEIKVSQNQVEPEPVVRISITPTQPIDVAVGPVAQSANQMGVEIEKTQPAPDAPRVGEGVVSFSFVTPAPVTARVVHHDLIAIDPGHGGNDPGALNRGYGLVESHLTLQLSTMVRDELRRLGWKVVMTRESDTEVGDPAGDDHQELQARCDVANEAGARLFVSIHINASTSSSLNGTTTYYYRQADKPFARAIQDATVSEDGIADDGVKREAFYVVKHTLMPAVLVETAFLSNPHDATLLQQTAFLQRVAHGIVRGLMDYTGGAQTMPPGTQ